MRKVFLATMGANALSECKYVSDDIKLSKNKYKFPLTYLMESDVALDDNVLVVTIVQLEKGAKFNSNYVAYKEEVSEVLGAKKANVEFVCLKESVEFTSRSFHLAFKKIAEILKDEDFIYMDFSFGSKPYALSMFVAGTYGIKACCDADIAAVIYAEPCRQDGSCAKIYDLTGLFYLNELSGTAQPGEKHGLDNILSFIMKD